MDKNMGTGKKIFLSKKISLTVDVTFHILTKNMVI